MRRLLALLGFALLALPSSAAAQSLEYAAPTASISRGAPLTFAVRTTAPAGSVVVRVSGNDEIDDTGLLTGPEGTWLDETATPAIEGLQVWSVPASSVLRQRPGHYYWQAYLTGDAATGAEEPIGPVQELVVTMPMADRGRGKLFPRFGRRGKASFYLSSENFPANVDGARFQTLIKKTAARWGLKAKRWTSVEAGVEDGYSVAGFSTRVPDDTLGVQTDFIARRRRRRARPRAATRTRTGPPARTIRRSTRSTSRASCSTSSATWRATSAISRAAPTRRWSRRSAPASGGAGRATSGSAAARRAPERLH